MKELGGAGEQVPVSDASVEFFQFRVIGWRPVGASPIISPEYVRSFSIKADAKQHETSWFDRDRLTQDVRDLVYGANFIARYDGFYIADILLKADAFRERQEDFSNEQMQEHFLNDVSSQMAMIIKEKLGHPHYFHNFKSDSHNHKSLHPWLVGVGLVVGLVIALIGFLTWESPTVLQALIWLILVAGFLALSATQIVFAFIRRVSTLSVDNIDRMLSVHPVRLEDDSLDVPIEKLNFKSAWWLADLRARKPEDGMHRRIAIGQLRRGFLRVSEHVTARMSLVKQRSGPLRRRLTQIFWLFFSILLTIGLVSFGATLILPSYPLLLWGMFIGAMAAYFTLTGFAFVLIILAQDLPRVKLLRATHGFFSAANPINEAIARIETDALVDPGRDKDSAGEEKHEGEPDARVESWPRAIPHVQDFSDLIKSFEIKLEGESQRLQIKQFWVTSCAALVGGLITALVFFMQQVSEMSGHAVSYSCEVTHLGGDAVMRQNCQPVSDNDFDVVNPNTAAETVDGE